MQIVLTFVFHLQLTPFQVQQTRVVFDGQSTCTSSLLCSWCAVSLWVSWSCSTSDHRATSKSCVSLGPGPGNTFGWPASLPLFLVCCPCARTVTCWCSNSSSVGLSLDSVPFPTPSASSWKTLLTTGTQGRLKHCSWASQWWSFGTCSLS